MVNDSLQRSRLFFLFGSLLVMALVFQSVPPASADGGTATPTPTLTATATPVTGLMFTGWYKGCTSGPYITCSATVNSTHTDPYRWDFDITYTYGDNRTNMGSNFTLNMVFDTGVFYTDVPVWWEMYPITNEVMPNRWIDVAYSGVPDLNPMSYPSGSWTIPSQPSPYDSFWIRFSRVTGTTETLVRTDSWHVIVATYNYRALTPTPTPTATLTSTPTSTPTATPTDTPITTCETDFGASIHAAGYTLPGTFFGGEVVFPEQSYVATDWINGGFVSNVLWNTHPDQEHWSEIGFTRGWQGQDIYTFYVAFDIPGEGYQEYKLTKTPSGTGTNHTYSIFASNNINTVWHLKLDTDDTFFVNMKLDSSWRISVGGEETSASSNMNPTISSSLIYYTGRNQSGAIPWPNDQSITSCISQYPLNWEWITYPLTGRAWSQ